MLKRFAVLAPADVCVSIQSPALSDVMVSAALQVVAPSMPNPEPAPFAHANPPDTAVASEALRSVSIPA
jgi:hypothetical protein